MTTPTPADGQSSARILVKRFLRAAAWAGWIPAVPLGLLKGWHSGAAYLLTALLVSADFLWIARTMSILLVSGAVPQQAAGRAVAGFLLRMVLLLLGLYVILKVYPREALALALGIAVPLALLAVSGARPVKGAE